MILQRTVDASGTAWFHSPDGQTVLTNIHPENPECRRYGCVVHWPTEIAIENVEGWPYNWREDKGVMERICKHGVGHPDPDQAGYSARIDRSHDLVHGCDGCCA